MTHLLSDLALFCYRYFRAVVISDVQNVYSKWALQKIKSQKKCEKSTFWKKVMYILYFKGYE